MLDRHANQAEGLLGLVSQRGPRMLAVVHHGDEQAELPLLWQLCLSLVSFGYAVTVLDATKPESDANPGLAELLDSAHWNDNASRDAPAWTVLPAGKSQLLVVSEVAIANRGASVLHFRDGDELKLFVQRVTPLDAGIATRLAGRDPDDLPVTESGDHWALMSRMKLPLGGIVLEAQETEHLYFRTLIDCQPGLSFYVQAKMNARYYAQRALGLLSDNDKAGKVWVRQHLVDASDHCAKGGAG